MRRLNLVASLVLGSCSLASAAENFTLVSIASGSANPPIIVVSSPSQFLDNGDFRLTPINVSPFPNVPTVRNLGDATEEWSRWHHTLSTLPGYGFLGSTPAQDIDIQSAMITLAIRTGGDTPDDDELVFEGASFTHTLDPTFNQFSLYTRTYDLLSIFGEAAIINAFQDDGQINLVVGNDSLVYNAKLEIHGNYSAPTPEPGFLTMLLASGVVLRLRVRR